MAEDIDLGKISLTPKGTWNEETHVEFNDVWKYGIGKFLALKDSVGITPSDDGVNWYELSSQGLSAYQMAVNEGFQGSVSDWLAYLRQPAVDAAAVAEAAVASLNITYQQELEEAKNELVDAVEDAVVDKVVRPLSISSSESKIGSYKMSGEDIDIYEKSVYLEDLPMQVGETKSYTVADEPLGYGVYFNVESFVASTGKSLTGSFFNNYYEIVDFAINENLQSTVTVKCNRAVTMATRGLLHLQYCKFYGDVIELKLETIGVTDIGNIHVSIPTLKFDKKFAFSFTMDDCPVGAWNKVFSIINNKWIDAQENYHYNINRSTGSYPGKTLGFTDGCGNEVRFPAGVAVWATYASTGWSTFLKESPTESDRDLNYKEAIQLLDWDWDLYFHNVFLGSSKATSEEIEDALKLDFDKILAATGRAIKVMVRPDGNDSYLTASQNTNFIDFMTSENAGSTNPGQNIYLKNSPLDLYKKVLHREIFFPNDQNLTDESLITPVITQLMALRDSSNPLWMNKFIHYPKYLGLKLLTVINDTFGKDGDDSIWFATLDEVYEYIFHRETAIINTSIEGSNIIIKFFLQRKNNFNHKDFSVVINGITSDNIVSVSSDNVYGYSYADKNEGCLINVNYNTKLIDRAEKYVSLLESDQNNEELYRDAIYHVSRLKPTLRDVYMSRITILSSPPILSSFSINNGDAQTLTRIVNIAITYTGQAPTEYIISENEDFSGGTWKTYAANVTFEISEGFTLKTLYAKLRNVYGVSAVKTDQITFAKPALVLNGISINSGDEKTSSRTVTVTFNYNGYPEYYWLSESPTLEGAVKTAFTGNPVSFELSSEVGVKTLYGKMDDGTTVSATTSDTIELIDADAAILNSIVINSGDAFTASGTVSVLLNTINVITKYRIGTTSDLSSLPWQTYSQATISFASGLSSGALTLYAQVGNTKSESEVKSSTITIVQPVVLSSVSLASGASDFAGLRVPVALTVSSGTATHYRLAESTSEISSKEWIAMSDNLSYNFASIGSKTLYAQVKNQVGESVIVNDSILLIEPALKILVGFNNDVNNNVNTVVSNGEFINQINYSLSTSYSTLNLKDSSGNSSSIKINLNTSYYQVNSNFPIAYGNQYNSASLSDALLSGMYDLSTYRKGYSMSSAPSAGGKMRLSLSLPSGSYKIRLLWSASSSMGTFTEVQRQDMFYGIYQGENSLTTSIVGTGNGWTPYNNIDFHNEMTFSITDAATPVDIAAWSNSMYYRPGFNLIEITKLN